MWRTVHGIKGQAWGASVALRHSYVMELVFNRFTPVLIRDLVDYQHRCLLSPCKMYFKDNPPTGVSIQRTAIEMYLTISSQVYLNGLQPRRWEVHTPSYITEKAPTLPFI